MCKILEYTEEEMIAQTNLSFKDAERTKKKLHHNKLREEKRE